jgi:site-specific DNA recombinase
MRVVGYIRVSTEEQAVGGVSLDSQRAKVAGYASLYNLDLVAVEVDAGVSAKTLDRPGLKAALDRLDRGEADGILVTKLDRLTRSVADLAVLLDRYFGDRAGRQLFSVGDNIDTRTAAGRLVLNVLMSVAQWERETVVERTRDAVRHKQACGHRVGQVPYGKRLADDGRTLLEDPAEAEVLAEIRRRRAAGETLRSIAGDLQARGVPTKNGKPWLFSTIDALCKRGKKGPP